MATKSVMFVNRNPYPIHLPDGRGGQVLFKPGDGTTHQWFSRLCGLRQLTRVDPNGEASKPVVPAAPASPGVPIITSNEIKPVVPVKPLFDDIETSEYALRRGIYHCKLCDIFRTGSSESMRAHLTLFHQQSVKVERPEPKLGEGDGEGEKLAVSSMQSTSQLTTKKDEDEAVEVRTASGKVVSQKVVEAEKAELNMPSNQAPEPVPVATIGSSKVFNCDHQGCGKAFKSKSGLTLHTKRMHAV